MIHFSGFAICRCSALCLRLLDEFGQLVHAVCTGAVAIRFGRCVFAKRSALDTCSSFRSRRLVHADDSAGLQVGPCDDPLCTYSNEPLCSVAVGVSNPSTSNLHGRRRAVDADDPLCIPRAFLLRRTKFL